MFVPDSQYLNQRYTKSDGKQALADKVMERGYRIVANVNRFKQPCLDKIQLYRDLYARKVKLKFRQLFNVVLPVFSRAIDALANGDEHFIEMPSAVRLGAHRA
jgi:hypothetical protein